MVSSHSDKIGQQAEVEGQTGLTATVNCVYCACVLYVTLSCQQASATVPKTAILNESSTLIFSAVTKSILDIFLEESPKLIRIQTSKK